MKQYKWTLRKGSKKEICPQCGEKRFVPYVLSSDGQTIATDSTGAMVFGRCDREQNCGYARYPDKCITGKPVSAAKQKRTPAPIVFNKEVAVAKRSALLDFAVKLCGLEAYKIWETYKIGAAHNGATIFWYFDANGICRSGKEIHYKEDGHRNKAIFPPVTWAHRDCTFTGQFTGEELLQPFFGEHLLKARPNDKVAIVESEKTAAIMSAFYPDTIWLACGGSQGLKKREKLLILKGRKVVLIPDHGQYYNWLNTANAWNFEIFDFCEKQPIFEGCDILDYFTQNL